LAGDERPTPFALPAVALFGLLATVVFAYLVARVFMTTPDVPSAPIGRGPEYEAEADTSAPPLPEKSAVLRGGGGKKVEAKSDPSDEAFDAQLTARLAKLDVDNERSIYALLETYGASRADGPPAPVERFVAAALRLSKHGEPIVRAGAFAVLGRVPRSALRSDPFTTALSDADARVRREAVVGRTLQGLDDHWRGLLPRATDEDARVRAAVARALGSVADPTAQAALLKLFADDVDDVVDAAADGLGAKVGGAAPDELLAGAKSARPRVRRATARALAEAHTPECLTPLARLVDDPAWTVQVEAIRGLSRFVGPSAAAACAKLASVAVDSALPRSQRFEALQALAYTETAPVLDALFAVATKDADPALKLAAARTLLARADPRSCAALTSLLETEIGPRCDDEDKQFVRATALATLQDAAGPAAKDLAKPTSAEAWRKILPSIEARVRETDFEYVAAYLPERW
jgi:HEAT repeat protein